jgi:uncharacterized protein YbaP (TraB family)
MPKRNILLQMITYAKKVLMKKYFGFLFLAILGFGQLFAQAQKSSLLWEITGNNLQQPSYLFGTFHIICKEDFSVSDILAGKLTSAKQFYGELKMDDPGMQQQLALKMIMKDKTIRSFMKEDEYKKMSDTFQKITGLPFSMFNNFKPFISLSMLALNSIQCTDKIQPETEFAKLAKESNIPVLGLETIDDQLAAVDKQPLDSQINTLRQMVLNFDSTQTEMKQLVAVYKTRDIDSIYRFIIKAGTDGKFEKDMIITRNKNWVPVMKKAMAEKATFFAVGVGHLGGHEGMISLLRQQGYRVTPVMF